MPNGVGCNLGWSRSSGETGLCIACKSFVDRLTMPPETTGCNCRLIVEFNVITRCFIANSWQLARCRVRLLTVLEEHVFIVNVMTPLWLCL